jgi:hypothetical protein
MKELKKKELHSIGKPEWTSRALPFLERLQRNLYK